MGGKRPDGIGDARLYVWRWRDGPRYEYHLADGFGNTSETLCEEGLPYYAQRLEREAVSEQRVCGICLDEARAGE